MIQKEVGRGTFGRVFGCIDKEAEADASAEASEGAHPPAGEVAIKVVHDAGRYYELSLIEAQILRDVNGMGGRGETHCCMLLNFFKLDGHACMVFETLGQSLYDFLKSNDYIPFPFYCVQVSRPGRQSIARVALLRGASSLFIMEHFIIIRHHLHKPSKTIHQLALMVFQQ